ncbi:hypothetical protein DY000_02004840 [Brassica cretica]|uniref:Uncharacterized protein n=1 Tax=Brassica cretica TaxID=69181 RepID=A0ABQ7BZ85_BRACR|nr:hypothetical protein DY000_02004840 [Brassica cretica]
MKEKTTRSCRILSPQSSFFTIGEPDHQTGLESSYITVGGVVPSEAIIDALAVLTWREEVHEPELSLPTTNMYHRTTISCYRRSSYITGANGRRKKLNTSMERVKEKD